VIDVAIFEKSRSHHLHRISGRRWEAEDIINLLEQQEVGE